MKIKHKLIITIMITVTIPVIVIGVLNFINVKNSLERSSLKHLRLIVEGKGSQILEYLTQKKGRTIEFASRFFLLKKVEQINSLASMKDKEYAGNQLSKLLENERDILDPDLEEIHIYDLEGKIIASTDDDVVGGYVDKNEPFFLNGIKETYIQDISIHRHHEEDIPFIGISTPIKERKTGKIIGVLMNGYHLKHLQNILSGKRGNFLDALLGGEKRNDDIDAFIYNKDGLMVCPIHEGMKMDINTEPVLMCMDKSEEITKKWINHDNKAVWGASECLNIEKDWKWALVVEKDEVAALASILNLKRISIIILLSAICISGTIALFIAQSISKPIHNLHKGTEVIGSGNLDHKVGTDAKDEIGQLSRAFDQMTENLKAVTTSRDELSLEIDERKKAEQSLMQTSQYLENLINYANAPIIVWDPGFRITRFNRAFERLTGYCADEVIGKELSMLFPEASKEESLGKIERTLTGEHWESVEVPILRKDGDIRIALWNSANIYAEDNKTLSATIAQGIDITERKKTEKQLIAFATELERSNMELEHFAYVVSHDLQEPLRMISSYVKLLERKYKGKLDKDADEFIFYAVDGAQRMQRMIIDILTYSRVGTKGGEFEPLEVSSALKNAIDNLQAVIEEEGVVITHDMLPNITADTTQIAQLFQNLIGNAIKFRYKEKPRIHISAKRIEDTEYQIPQIAAKEGWLFSVTDNGIGIEQKDFGRVFQIFQRTHSSKEYPGSGIGLAVCKKIVQRHGGCIWVESLLGQGTTFHFTIPDARDI